MYAFHFHPNGLYAGSDPCEFDQREPGRKIIPAWATDQPPPPMKDGFERVFNVSANQWAYVPLTKDAHG